MQGGPGRRGNGDSGTPFPIDADGRFPALESFQRDDGASLAGRPTLAPAAKRNGRLSAMPDIPLAESTFLLYTI